MSSTWPQGNDALSMLVAPERLAHFLGAPPEQRRAEVLATLARLYGEPARSPDALLERARGVDPFTQGYIAQCAPGDLTAVGPCTAPTSRRSTSAARTTGSVAG